MVQAHLAEQASGEVVVDVERPYPRTVAVTSRVCTCGGAILTVLRSTYVGCGEPAQWRAIHVPLDEDGQAAEDASGVSVESLAAVGDGPSIDHLRLDHLHELRDRLSAALKLPVAIEIDEDS